MKIVLTMAGKYSRFQSFGKKIPKYLLPLSSGTMLSEVIRQFKLSAPCSEIYLIANKADQLFVPVVQAIMSSYEIPLKNLTYIDDTVDQVSTALHVDDFLELASTDEPICFANIDTVLFNRRLFFEKLKSLSPSESGVLDTFPGRSPQYSYCMANDEGCITHIAEKKVISDYACSGLYGFRSLADFSSNAEILIGKNGITNFSELYNMMISNGALIKRVHSPYPADTVVLGTPEEYVKNIHREFAKR